MSTAAVPGAVAAPGVPGAATPSVAAENVDLRAFVFLLAPLAALWVLINHFDIESEAFSNLALVAFAGFGVHYFLPLRHRLPFFLGLSLLGIDVVLGVRQTLWLVGAGLGLVGLCHLPVSGRARVALLLLAGVALALLRAGWATVPVPASVWPILASMFMFRLVVYVYDTRHDPKLASFWSSLSYFFLLPNVCFPLFPVVDYKNFRRNYYNDERHRIYYGGLRWIFRGVIQLLLYRVVYQTLVIDPVAVENVTDLGQYLIWPYLLYLRVSGQFHIIVGMLRLFGFNLPETHHSYYLASSFTDLWRRINIYWTDFMMKVFYYPAFFKLRKRGQAFALVASTVMVFVLTWLLHAYQWFWLRGAATFTWNDTLFWGVLGVLVVFNALREWQHPQPRALSERALDWRSTLALAARTVALFCAMSVLWSLWSTESLTTWLSLWSAALRWPETVRWTSWVSLGIPVVIALAAIAKARAWAPKRRVGAEAGGTIVVAVAACLVLTSSVRLSPYLGPAGSWIVSLRHGGLNQADAVALERGYYENLLAVDRFNGELALLYMNRPLTWGKGLIEEGLAKRTSGVLPYELLPSVEGPFKGATLRTNSWGMHDKEYAKTPPIGCHRIALLGASHAMGSGVERQQTFEAVLEDRLNQDRPGRCYEILNFAVHGYSGLLQVEVLETKVLEFQPDTIFYVGHPEDSLRVSRFLAGLVSANARLPFDDLSEIVAQAGVTAQTPSRIVVQRLEPFADQFLTSLYRRIVKTASSRGICAGFVYMPMVPDMKYAADLEHEKQLAASAGLVVLDLFGAYDIPDRSTLFVAEWDLHPNARGHQLVAEKLYSRVIENERALFDCAEGSRLP